MMVCRYITGARPLDTTVFADSAYPYQALGPAMLLWKPWKPEDDEPTTLPVQPKKVKGKGHALKGKEKEKEKAVDPTKRRPEPTAKSPRTCWLRLHPAIFDEVFNAVRIATSAVLSNVQLAGGDTAEVHLADLREKLCGFEITGPKSAQVLRGALEPTQASPSKEFKEVCEDSMFVHSG
jgi:ribonuclease P/MRP protein subunit POP1